MKFGYFLASEQFGPLELLDQARRAEAAGFEGLWISDHFHPWNEEQGESPFVWSVIGALTQTVPDLPVTTSVTCPILRTHPVIIAQAAATVSVMSNGSFRLGVGTGENLNEHVLGQPWPPFEERLDRLEEAVEIMRRLWTGEVVDHHGAHYDVVNARLYTLPDAPPEVFVSAFGPKAAEGAIGFADGFVTMAPEVVEKFRSAKPDAVIQTGIKMCYDADEDLAVELAHSLWGNEVLPGQLAQELPTTAHIEQATQLVTPEMVAEEFPCGPDVERMIDAVQQRIDTGYDEIYVQQIGPDMDGFFKAWSEEVLPHFRSA